MEIDVNKSVNVANTFLLVQGRVSPDVVESRISDACLLALMDRGINADVHVSMSAVLVAKKKKIEGAPRQKAWTYDLDDHSFYVLDLETQGTFVYDITSQSWTKFETQGYGRWNFTNGFAWKSAGKIVGGDLYTSAIYEMDPDSFLDMENTPIEYRNTAILPSALRTGQRVDEARLLLSIEKPILSIDAHPEVTLKWSDDNCQNWSPEFVMRLTDQKQQMISWTGLGSFTNSGRVFDIKITGAFTRLDSLIVRVDGKESDE